VTIGLAASVAVSAWRPRLFLMSPASFQLPTLAG